MSDQTNASVSIPKEDVEWFNDFLEMRWREHKGVSGLILDACKEFYAHHKEGNPQFTLDPYQDKDFESWPAMGSSPGRLREFYSKVTEAEYKKIDAKLRNYTDFHNQALAKF